MKRLLNGNYRMKLLVRKVNMKCKSFLVRKVNMKCKSFLVFKAPTKAENLHQNQFHYKSIKKRVQ